MGCGLGFEVRAEAAVSVVVRVGSPDQARGDGSTRTGSAVCVRRPRPCAAGRVSGHRSCIGCWPLTSKRCIWFSNMRWAVWATVWAVTSGEGRAPQLCGGGRAWHVPRHRRLGLEQVDGWWGEVERDAGLAWGVGMSGWAATSWCACRSARVQVGAIFGGPARAVSLVMGVLLSRMVAAVG
jgi:alkylation response protein AidB-like acyl-CoA dehydrogenase